MELDINLEKINAEIRQRLAKEKKFLRDLIEVKKSTIPGAGLGLFLKEDIPNGYIPRNVIIDCYYGRKIKTKDLDNLPEQAFLYLMQLDDDTYIDGFTEKNFLSFCNDARGIIRIPYLKNNCRFQFLDDEQNIALISSRRIKAGEELFAFYGASYWRIIGKL